MTTRRGRKGNRPKMADSAKEPVEKNGSWKVECATPQNNKILWISSDNGHYSEIEISALKGESLKPAWELLGTLRTDNPEIFSARLRIAD